MRHYYISDLSEIGFTLSYAGSVVKYIENKNPLTTDYWNYHIFNLDGDLIDKAMEFPRNHMRLMTRLEKL